MLQLLLLAAFVIPAILFILAQQKTLQVINPENREMSPGSVWFQLIPAFGLVWQFIVVIRIARSISKEMASKTENSIPEISQIQNKETDDFSTYTIGLAYCTLTTLGTIINFVTRNSSTYPASLGSFLVLIGMACWIIYWVRLVYAKNKVIRLSVAIDR